MTLPYANATSGKNAMKETQKILRNFGASSCGYMENFDDGTLTLQFEWKGRKVTLEANASGYAAALLRDSPWSSRMHVTEDEYKARHMKQAQLSVFSILRDWIKGQCTAIEVGMLTFEGAFLGQILLPTGKTVLQLVQEKNLLSLPEAAR